MNYDAMSAGANWLSNFFIWCTVAVLLLFILFGSNRITASKFSFWIPFALLMIWCVPVAWWLLYHLALIIYTTYIGMF